MGEAVKSQTRIIRQFMIASPMDILSLDIIDFNRLNGCWSNSADALETISSWFEGAAVATIVKIHNYFEAPKRDDWPRWNHRGVHEDVGRSYWNWFCLNHPKDKLYFGDSPDFHGVSDDGSLFWGDIGKVSASTFALTQRNLKQHDLWISLLGDGSNQVLIEPLVNMADSFTLSLHTQRGAALAGRRKK